MNPDAVTALFSGAAAVLGALGAAVAKQTSSRTGAAKQLSDSYGDALDDLRAQIRESATDRRELHGRMGAQGDEMAQLRVRMREMENAHRSLAGRFNELLEAARAWRSILRAHRIEHPPGPDFLEDDSR